MSGASSLLFSGISFYVDPGSTTHPYTVRVVKGSGGTIVVNPKDADILLVQSNTTSGQDHLRTWNAEKRVLAADWASKSISSGRLLKESDNWGNCLVTEDPTLVFEQPEEPIHNLPTPRITPVEALHPRNGATPPVQPIVQAPFSQFPPQINTPQPGMQSMSPAMQQQILQAFALSQYSQQPLTQSFVPSQQVGLPQGMQQPIHPAQVGAGIPYDPNVMAALVMDILQRYPAVPSLNGVAPQNMNLLQMAAQSPAMTQPPPIHDDRSRSSSVLAPTSSISRKPSVDVKGKGKATPQGSSTSSRSTPSSSSAKHIFTHFGQPLTFYVVIDFKKRPEVVAEIKTHGGEISVDPAAADFGVLNPKSKDFPVLLETVLSSERTKAVRHTFVLDSVERGVLQDPSGYRFEAPANKSHRKKRKSTPPSPVKSDREASSSRQAPSSRQASSSRHASSSVPVNVGKETKVDRGSPSPDLSRPYSPSPTPPPESTRVPVNDRIYRYPPIELEYIRSYTKVLFGRDHQMTIAALAAKLHKKLPHHTAKAFTAYLAGTMREDIDGIRKRAGIAYRKKHYKEPQSSAEAPPAKRRKVAEPAPVEDPTAVQQDLNTLAHFFANGGDALTETDDEQDQREKDGQVWARLTAKSTSKTGVPWDVFYQQHYEAVTELYDALVQAQEDMSE
ncbi:hypothetical protein FB45DRAFT_1003795 [Roridomyces roridus]|uniref:BRCT domain-containing protein n=1 Tax=Roridomyces roridus TaxID=1738132 RepID=A0AAD7FNU3_9AGAR|nr:hypothetical protein FB45DRAFT_1003795 [Roridomyces roridus]